MQTRSQFINSGQDRHAFGHRRVSNDNMRDKQLYLLQNDNINPTAVGSLANPNPENFQDVCDMQLY